MNPLTRLATFELSATKVNGKGNKRQKTNDSNASEAANMHEINKQSDGKRAQRNFDGRTNAS